MLNNTIWSLLGQLMPALVGFVLVPRIIHGFGDARFGLLSLAWAVIGYLSFLDLGISRAVTKSVAASLAESRMELVRTQVSSASALLVAIGVAAAVVLLPLAPWISFHALRMPADLRDEALLSVQLLCLGLPLTLLMNGLRGVLEAYQRFGLVNLVRLPFGVATFMLPWLLLPYTHSIAVAIGWLMGARAVAVVAYAVMVARVMGANMRPVRPAKDAMRQMLGYGAWITVSNVVSPLMVSFDRFIIGGLLSVAVVTYYVTPYQVATQLLIFPAAIVTVLFPVFASLWGKQPDRLMRVYDGALRFVFVVLLAATAAIVAVAPELLSAWLGPRFGELSAGPLRWLMAGMLANGLAHLPFTMIQSTGRSDWTAKLHLVEMPLYLLALVVCAQRFGLAGVASVWCLRAIVDLVVLYLLAARLASTSRATRVRQAGAFVGALVVLALVAALPALPLRIGAAGLVSLGCLAGLYRLSGGVGHRLRNEVALARAE